MTATLKRINLPLFDVYKKLHGDLMIPSKFVIPNLPEWPAESHGMKLGNYINRVRESAKDKRNGEYSPEDLKKLLDMGLELNVDFFKSQEILKAVEAYHTVHGDVNIPKFFKIPATDAWPKSLWNRDLYNIIHGLRVNQKDCKVIRPKLTKLGIDLSPADLELTVVLDALKAYKTIHGNLRVNVKYEVPANDERFPEDTWGMKLGKFVFKIRSLELFTSPENKAELEAVGLEYETKAAPPDFKHIYNAIKMYKHIHGHTKIPQDFEVPHDNEVYRRATWGMKLGHIVHSMRSQGTYKQYANELKLMDIDYESKQASDFTQKYNALVAYKKLKGNLLVPRNFQIEHSDVNFPEEAWGLKLGNAVKRIRYKGYYARHRDQLEALGFIYKGGDSSEKSANNIVEID